MVDAHGCRPHWRASVCFHHGEVRGGRAGQLGAFGGKGGREKIQRVFYSTRAVKKQFFLISKWSFQINQGKATCM